MPGRTREAREQTRLSGVPPQMYMCLLQESSPNLPKAAHLSKAELSMSYGLACASHHHGCLMPALLHGLTSSRDRRTKPRAIALERTPSPDCWNLDTFFQGK